MYSKPWDCQFDSWRRLYRSVGMGVNVWFHGRRLFFGMCICRSWQRLFKLIGVILVALQFLLACQPVPKVTDSTEGPISVQLDEVLHSSGKYYGHRLQIKGIVRRSAAGGYLVSEDSASGIESSPSTLNLTFTHAPDPAMMAECEGQPSVVVGILEQDPETSLLAEYIQTQEKSDKWKFEFCQGLSP